MLRKFFIRWFSIVYIFFFACAAIAVVENIEPALVKLDNHSVFEIKGRVGSLDPGLRAEVVSKRLKEIAGDKSINPDEIYIAKYSTFNDIKVGNEIIVSILASDAKMESKTLDQLTQENLDKIKQAIVSYRIVHRPEFWIMGLLKSFFSTLVLVAILGGINLCFNKLKNFLRLCKMSDVKIQKSRIFSKDRAIRLLLLVVKLIHVLLVVFILYFYFVLMLSFFPWTISISETLFSNFTNTLGSFISAIFNYFPNLLLISLSVVTVNYINLFIKFIFNEIADERIKINGFYPEWSDITSKIFRVVSYIVMFSIILPYFPGANTDAFKIISIFFGVLISLGSTSSLSNMITGIVLTYTRAFKVGDRLKIDNTVGDVTERTLLVTRIKTIKNEIISIPNSIVINSHIMNYSSFSSDSGLILNTVVSLGYSVSWEQVSKLLVSAALATEHVLSEPSPFVLQLELGDFYVKYQINAYTHHPELMQGIYSELHKNIQEKFSEAGVEIMSPHYSAIRDGNHIAIPDSYISKDYRSPHFRLE